MIDSYSKLSYRKYKEISDGILYFDKDIDRTTFMISELASIPFEEVEMMQLSEYNALAKKCSFLLTPPDTTLRKAYSELTINGIDYVVTTNINNMSVAQYIDFTGYMKDVDNKIPELLSIFIIPKGHIYNKDYDINKTIDDIANYLPLDIMMQLSAFFLLWSQSLIKGLLKVKIGELKKIMRKEKDKTLQKAMKQQIEEYQHTIGSLF